MWWHMFVNRMDAFAIQIIENGRCRYSTRYQPVTPDLFDRHLSGDITLGLPAIDEMVNLVGAFGTATRTTIRWTRFKGGCNPTGGDRTAKVSDLDEPVICGSSLMSQYQPQTCVCLQTVCKN